MLDDLEEIADSVKPDRVASARLRNKLPWKPRTTHLPVGKADPHRADARLRKF